jgi:hypothetical protein
VSSTSGLGKITDDDGWECLGRRDPTAGFYLSDISHDGHYLAASIRLERIGVAAIGEHSASRKSDPANYQVFGLGAATEVAAPTVQRLGEGATDPRGFYAPHFKVSTKYELESLVYESDQKMELELAYLFTRYNKDPSHEPGGIIPAARIYPLLTFKIPGVGHDNRKPRYRRATAVQALYRLHFQLTDRGGGNQAGIFLDNEEMGIGGAIVAGTARGLRAGSFVFAAAEKPLYYEVIGRGLRHGQPAGWNRAIAGWDNIHQWSHDSLPFDRWEEGMKLQPATPGLPHGAHLHWRWGASAATGAAGLPGGPQYGGHRGPGTPLIDGRLPNQSLEFAIINHMGAGRELERKVLRKIDNDPILWLFRDFSEVWESVQPRPNVLLPSGNLVIWMSITAFGPGYHGAGLSYREISIGSGAPPDVPRDMAFALPEWGGTLFANGVFFAHEDHDILPTALKLLPGVGKPQYLPKAPERRWRR